MPAILANTDYRLTDLKMADFYEELGWPSTNNETDEDWQTMAQFLFETDWNPEDLLGDWPRPIPPASKSAVENLPESKVEDTSKECIICLKEYECGEIMKKMPCDHIFHKTCLVTWLENNNSCPCCRHELPTDDVFYESFKRFQKKIDERVNRVERLHNSMFT